MSFAAATSGDGGDVTTNRLVMVSDDLSGLCINMHVSY